jgi:hypothetical protein
MESNHLTHDSNFTEEKKILAPKSLGSRKRYKERRERIKVGRRRER